MTMRSEIIPSDEQRQVLIEMAVIPVLKQIARDIGRKVRLTPSIMIGEGVVKGVEPIVVGKAGDDILNGEMRLRFREAFGGRILMHSECIFDRVQAVANCSGLTLKAEIKLGTVKRTALTVRYSVWHWTGWI